MSKIVGIKCIAPVFDRSGYAEWSRNYILALIESGSNITIQPVSFDKMVPQEDPSIQKLAAHVNLDINYNVVICWSIPPVSKQLLDKENKNIFKIVFTLWETNKLPNGWASIINESADQCWTAGDWNLKIFKNSGVTKPIRSFHYPLNKGSYNLDNYILRSNFEEDIYKFYFISQWTERKNFVDLLETYWSTFSVSDKVCLYLKTHLADNSINEKERLITLIKSIKQATKYSSTAPVIILSEMFSKGQILALHKLCDCYVSASRGEGLGLGMLEARLFGNTVMTHTFGEQSSYIDDHNGIIYGHTLRPVTRMNSDLYTPNQFWAQPNLKELSEKMKDCYEQKVSFSVDRDRFWDDCTYDAVSKNIIESINNSL